MKRLILFSCLVGAFLALANRAAAQISVTGIANNNYSYANSVTFTVQAQAGYNYLALLDGQPVPVGSPVLVTKVDYHELVVYATNQTSQALTSQLFRFILRSSERGDSERGLPAWVPYPMIPSADAEFAGAQLRVILPAQYPVGMDIPVVIWVVNNEGHAVRVNGEVGITGNAPIAIKRGVGSGFLVPGTEATTANYDFQIGGLSTNKTVTFEADTAWTSQGGLLSGVNEWPANSRILIPNGLGLAANGTLTIGAGSIVRVSAGGEITNNSQIVIAGTVDQPVVFVPVDRAQAWGGFVQHASNSGFTATGAIFTGSGARDCWFKGHECSSGYYDYIGSHRGQQALISLAGVNCNLTMTDCAAIYLRGQLGHSYGTSSVINRYEIALTRFLLQGAVTGGEYTDARFVVNDSAFVDFPDDSVNFEDGDNDGLYITNERYGAHSFTNTLFGWTKDDGIDSGGGGGGTLNFVNCWFESIFHEGNSLSGTGKISNHYTNVILNCGQAIEDGYDSPVGRVYDCLYIGNLVGVRFGDNYNWTYNGSISATNSLLLYNYRNVWGMNWADWTYRYAQMNVQGNWLSAVDANHPNNTVWDPTTDGWRLAAYRNTGLGKVGVGLAVRTNRLSLSAITNGAAIRLSIFATNEVRVEYSYESGGTALASGTAVFPAGETVTHISPGSIAWQDYDSINLWLGDTVGADLTGTGKLTYQEILPGVAFGTAQSQLSAWELGTGIPILLTRASTKTVSVTCSFEGAEGVLTNAAVSFTPGVTNVIVPAPAAGLENQALLRVRLTQPVHAELLGTPEIYYVQTVPTPSATLVARSSWWHYFDQGFEPAGAWESLDYDVSTWRYGQAELGLGDGDENTRLRTNNLNNRADPAYYFRQLFYLDPSVAFTNLTLWLKYDDGAVVYINDTPALRIKMTNGEMHYLSWATGGSENATISSNLNVNVLVPGTNIVAVEVHQDDNNSSDISFDFELIGSPPPPPPPLTVELGKLTADRLLFWDDPAARLEFADDVGGPWTLILTNSPFTIPLDGSHRFYRLRK